MLAPAASIGRLFISRCDQNNFTKVLIYPRMVHCTQRFQRLVWITMQEFVRKVFMSRAL